MAESTVVDISLKPLREQIEVMSQLLKSGQVDKPGLIKALDDAARSIKDICTSMGVRITFN